MKPRTSRRKPFLPPTARWARGGATARSGHGWAASALRLALRRVARRRDVAWISPVEPELVRDRLEPGAAATARGLGSIAIRGRSSVDPASLVVRADESAAIRAAVARLDEPYREVVALRFFGELSLAEIAAESQRPVPTVKTQLRRGLIRLRAMLAEPAR